MVYRLIRGCSWEIEHILGIASRVWIYVILYMMSNQVASENDLVQLLAAGLKQNFNTDIAVREFAGGYGIADLVFAKDFYTNKNLLERKPINNYYALKSYLTLPDQESFTFKEIVRSSGGGISIGRDVRNILVGDGYIQKEGQVYYKSLTSFKNPIKKLIAIEVKLRDWKQGILQARRYKSYADECYLAILSKYEKNIDKTYMARFGIGLILFNENNGDIWIKDKPSENITSPIHDSLIDMFARELFLFESRSYQNFNNISFQI